MQRTGEPLVIPPIQNARTATLVGPEGSSREVQLSPDQKQFVKNIDISGLYRLTGLPGDKDQEIVYAVNLADPHESDNPAQQKIMVGDTSSIEASASSVMAKREFWRTLALIAVALLMIEWWVYHQRLGL